MWRRIPARLGLTIFGVEIISNEDIIDPSSPTAQKLAEQAKIAIEKETGWDRVKGIFEIEYVCRNKWLVNLWFNTCIFFISEFNTYSPELEITITAASVGTLIGFCMGALPASKAEYNDFITRNKATKFENHFEAKVMCALFFIKKAHNKIVLPFYRLHCKTMWPKPWLLEGGEWDGDLVFLVELTCKYHINLHLKIKLNVFNQ